MLWKRKGLERQKGRKMDEGEGERAARATGWRDERRRDRLRVNDREIGWDVWAG